MFYLSEILSTIEGCRVDCFVQYSLYKQEVNLYI